MGTGGLRLQGAANRVLRKITGIPDAQLSVIAPVGPSAQPALVDLMLRVGRATADSPPRHLAERRIGRAQRQWADEWPSEHYRMLPLLARQVGARCVVEVGTFTGMGSLALLDSDAEVVTYDIVPWQSIPDSVLTQSDFTSGRLEQRIGDLSRPGYFGEQLETLRRAQLIFVDGPKDRVFEPKLWALLSRALAGTGAIVLFDDIRVANMVSFWHSVASPKLDVTSIGHWSGSGLVRL
jgi:predicted O-methyltransferase YrrM